MSRGALLALIFLGLAGCGAPSSSAAPPDAGSSETVTLVPFHFPDPDAPVRQIDAHPSIGPPRVAADDAGGAVLAWTKNADGHRQVFMSRHFRGTSGWEAPRAISSPDTDASANLALYAWGVGSEPNALVLWADSQPVSCAFTERAGPCPQPLPLDPATKSIISLTSAANRKGVAVAAWTTIDQSSGSTRFVVRADRFDGAAGDDGSWSGMEPIGFAAPTGHVAAAVGADGAIAVAWEGAAQGTLLSRVYRGGMWEPERTITTAVAAIPFRVHFVPTGELVAVYASDAQGVRRVVVSVGGADGAWGASPIVLGSAAVGGLHELDSAVSGNAINVAWIALDSSSYFHVQTASVDVAKGETSKPVRLDSAKRSAFALELDAAPSGAVLASWLQPESDSSTLSLLLAPRKAESDWTEAAPVVAPSATAAPQAHVATVIGNMPVTAWLSGGAGTVSLRVTRDR